jgi:hypothetical protein
VDPSEIANLVLAIVAIAISVGFAIDARRSANRAAAIERHARIGQVWAPIFRLHQTLGQGGLEARAGALQAAGRGDEADELVRERLRPFLERLEDGLAVHPPERFLAAWALHELLEQIDIGLRGAEALERVRNAATTAKRQVSDYSRAHPSGDLGEYDA